MTTISILRGHFRMNALVQRYGVVRPDKWILTRTYCAPRPRPRPSPTMRYMKYWTWPTVVLGGGTIGYGWYVQKRRRAQAAELQAVVKSEFGVVPKRPDLPTFTLSEVGEHKSSDKRIWVSYSGGVYDVTDFVEVHPGGLDKIKLAYGGPLEPFWALYAVHKKSEVLEILEEMRIGNLDAASVAKVAADLKNDPYANDPQRHASLMPSSVKPFNAETPPESVAENFLTPNELFFVRNHLPVPEINMEKYALEIGGIGLPTRRFTLDELKRRFPSVTITAAMQCAGNRRNEMNPVKQVKGLTWGFTAISNATWTGVRLADVLGDIGLTDARLQKNEGAWSHVQFEGLDTDPTGQRYGASIPIDKAVDRKGDVILAYEMNGEPLPRDHGFPLRAVVPGIVGARNVKWLAKIYVSDQESSSFWQQNDYKSFSPSTDWDTVDFKSAPAIQEAPIQSAICSPINGDSLPKVSGSKEVEVKGYAWSGGGRGVIRVDVSADGGKTWKTATLRQDKSQSLYRMWAWSLWSCTLPLPNKDIDPDGGVQLVCKATDASYNSQPDGVPGIWNLRGVLNNAWHRVSVSIDQ